jgi:hypothetical protein
VSLGILVVGNNHFIVRGPLPSPRAAGAIAKRWSTIRIGSGIDMTRPEPGFPWHASTKEFRENLEWAVVIPSDHAPSSAVQTLLDELAKRGIDVRRGGEWEGQEMPPLH